MLSKEQIKEKLLGVFYNIPKTKKEFFKGNRDDIYTNTTNMLLAKVYAEILEDTNALNRLEELEKDLLDNKKQS